jgi:MoaD family protein
MRIRIKLFAALRETVGQTEVELQVTPGATVREVMETLVAQYPALKPQLGFVHVAVNRRYVLPQEELHDGDEVALVPPVGGG